MSSFKKPQPNLGLIPKPKEKIMKTFELELDKSLSGLDSDFGFLDAVNTACEEKYGRAYIREWNRAWNQNEAPKLRLIVEYETK